ncbi:MAG: hypothetical protein R3B72_35445 [Polyangiaceae bacterium]
MSPSVPLDALRPDDQTRVEAATRAIVDGGGERIMGVALVGEAVPRRRHDGALHLELLVLLDRSPHVASLTNIGRRLDTDLSLHLFTSAEWLRSADVLALDLAEQRARHVSLHGRIPFADLVITARHLRLAVERELRMCLRDLREGAVRHGRTPLTSERLAPVLRRLAVVAHQLPPLLGEPPGEAASQLELIAALGDRCGEGRGWLSAWTEDNHAAAGAELLDLVAPLTALVSAVLAEVDAFGASDAMA